ncbi:MAG: hypothetical protein ACUVTQ_12360, partial [Desulfotomaculales bacterium]
MRRVIAACLLALLLLALLAPASPALANLDTNEYMGPPGQQEQDDGDPWAPTDKGGTFEKILAGVLAFPVRLIANLAQAGGFKTLDVLVFQQGLTDEQKKCLPWEPGETEAVRMWFDALCAVTAPFFIIVIAASAFRLKHGALNPAARAEAVESVQRWLLAAAIIILAPLAVQSLMWVAGILTDAVAGAFNAVGQALGRDVNDWASVSMTGKGIATGSVLGTTVVRVFLTFMFLYLNALYIIRKYVLTVMFAFTPLMALLWAANRNTTAAAIWLGELASNAFMPVAHGLALGTLMLMCDVKNFSGTWLTFLVMIYAVVPTAEAIRNSLQSLFTRWAGIGEERIARSALMGAMGLGGILSVARVAGATLGGGKVPPSAADGAQVSGASRSLAPQPVRQIGFRPGGMDVPATPYPAQGTAGGLQVGFAAPIPAAAAPAPTRAAPQRVSPELQRALAFGAKAGKVAMAATGLVYGAVAGAVPGGEAVAAGGVAVAGVAAPALGATGHLAASYTAKKVAPKLAQVPQVRAAAGYVRQVAQLPAVQKVATATRQAGVILQGVFDPRGAVQRASYPDRTGGLDAWRE